MEGNDSILDKWRAEQNSHRGQFKSGVPCRPNCRQPLILSYLLGAWSKHYSENFQFEFLAFDRYPFTLGVGILLLFTARTECSLPEYDVTVECHTSVRTPKQMLMYNQSILEDVGV
jgi:hypothetical protein